MAVSGVARCVGEVDDDDEVLSSSDWMANITAEMSKRSFGHSFILRRRACAAIILSAGVFVIARSTEDVPVGR